MKSASGQVDQFKANRTQRPLSPIPGSSKRIWLCLSQILHFSHVYHQIRHPSMLLERETGGQITRSSQTSANHSLLLRDNASCVLGRALTMLFSYLRKLSLYHSPTHTRPLLTQDTMDGFVCGGESVYWLNSPSALGRSRCQRRGVVQLTDNLRNVSSSLLHLTFIFANPITACLIFGTSFEPLCFQMFWGPCRSYCTTSS